MYVRNMYDVSETRVTYFLNAVIVYIREGEQNMVHDTRVKVARKHVCHISMAREKLKL